MEDAKRLARRCEATENAKGSWKNGVNENAKYVISCIFRLYLAPIALRK